ncbi:hypothetical protein J6590_106341, partial [Homalodisca vitripennis]
NVNSGIDDLFINPRDEAQSTYLSMRGNGLLARKVIGALASSSYRHRTSKVPLEPSQLLLSSHYLLRFSESGLVPSPVTKYTASITCRHRERVSLLQSRIPLPCLEKQQYGPKGNQPRNNFG